MFFFVLICRLHPSDQIGKVGSENLTLGLGSGICLGSSWYPAVVSLLFFWGEPKGEAKLCHMYRYVQILCILIPDWHFFLKHEFPDKTFSSEAFNCQAEV